MVANATIQGSKTPFRQALTQSGSQLANVAVLLSDFPPMRCLVWFELCFFRCFGALDSLRFLCGIIVSSPDIKTNVSLWVMEGKLFTLLNLGSGWSDWLGEKR